MSKVAHTPKCNSKSAVMHVMYYRNQAVQIKEKALQKSVYFWLFDFIGCIMVTIGIVFASFILFFYY
jgi:hypothetical protein